MFGLVRKAGMAALANWHPSYAALRQEQFKSWVEVKGSLLQGASPAALNLLGVKPPYVLPFHAGRGCNVYYNDRWVAPAWRRRRPLSPCARARPTPPERACRRAGTR